MKKIILLDKDKDFSLFIQSYCECLNITIESYDTIEKVKEVISGNIKSVSGIVVNMSPHQEYQDFVKELPDSVPLCLFILGRDDVSGINAKHLKIIHKPFENFDALKEWLLEIKPQRSSLKTDDFVKISTDFFVKYSNVNINAFIELGESKKVKIKDIKSGLLESTLDHMKDSTDHVLIKVEDLDKYFLDILDSLLIKYDTASNGAIYELHTSLIEYTHNKLRLIGLSNHEIDYAARQVERSVENIFNDLTLFSEINKVLECDDSIYRISLITAYFSCLISRKASVGSQKLYHEIVLASMFQDASLENKKLAMISRFGDMKEMGLSEQDYLLLTRHPEKSSELIKDYDSFSSDVSKMIQTHHVRPHSNTIIPGQKSLVSLSFPQKVFSFSNDLAYFITDENFTDSGPLTEYVKKNYSIRGYNKIISSFLLLL